MCWGKQKMMAVSLVWWRVLFALGQTTCKVSCHLVQCCRNKIGGSSCRIKELQRVQGSYRVAKKNNEECQKTTFWIYKTTKFKNLVGKCKLKFKTNNTRLTFMNVARAILLNFSDNLTKENVYINSLLKTLSHKNHQCQ